MTRDDITGTDRIFGIIALLLLVIDAALAREEENNETPRTGGELG